MKKLIITLLTVASCATVFSQGIVFNNGLVGTVVAPIFGPEGNEPLNPAALSGNSTARNGAPAGFPVATNPVAYTGLPLSGNGYSAQLWGALQGQALQPLLVQAGTNAILKFRTVSGQYGLVRTITPSVVVPGVDIAGGINVVDIQMRVWDNRGDTITSWAQALQDDTILRGTSELFSLTLVTGNNNLTPLRSFNIHSNVPEPSVIAMGVIGLGTLVLLRRRKN